LNNAGVFISTKGAAAVTMQPAKGKEKFF